MDIILYELLSPYDSFHKPNVRDFYSKNIQAKLDGYKDVYKDALPIDAHDLICDHFIMCVPGPTGMEIACTFKSIRLSQARRFKMELPCFGLVKSMGKDLKVKETLESMERYQNRFEQKGEDVFYTYSWTIDKKYRKTELGKKLKMLTLAVVKYYSEEYKAPGIMITGMEKVKTDQNFMWMGFENFENKKGKKLGHIESPLFANERALMLKKETWSPEFLKKADELYQYYENRICLGKLDASNLKIAV